MTPSPLVLFADALHRGEDLTAHDREGGTRRVAISEWIGDACPVDGRLLDRAVGPVLDVGCGPGRHVRALKDRGVDVLGIDAAPAVVRFARRRGATPVLTGDVFAPIPRAGWWKTALLLDGNLGIGGDPTALLVRLRTLLAPGAQILCETDAPGTGIRREPIRLADRTRHSVWFSWAHVGSDDIGSVAQTAGWSLVDRWEDHGRWFACLR